MTNATNALEKSITDHVLGIATFTRPTTTYLALFTADPTETGSTSAEITAGGYSRQELTSKMGPAGSTDGLSENTSAITFGPATANWGTITHCAVMTAATGGTMLVAVPLLTPQVINNGGNLQFAVGQFSLRTE